MKTLLIKLGSVLLQAMPIEQIVAIILNKAIDKVGTDNMDTAVKSLEHINEACSLCLDILADKSVDQTEAAEIVSRLRSLRVVLLERWAEGKPAKDVQQQLASLGAPYDPVYV